MNLFLKPLRMILIVKKLFQLKSIWEHMYIQIWQLKMNTLMVELANGNFCLLMFLVSGIDGFVQDRVNSSDAGRPLPYKQRKKNLLQILLFCNDLQELDVVWNYPRVDPERRTIPKI